MSAQHDLPSGLTGADAKKLHEKYKQGSISPSEVGTEIEIDAPVEKVWDILVDLEKYPEWNPFTKKVESTLLVGDEIHLEVHMRKNKIRNQTEIVNLHEPNKKICWGVQYMKPAILNANRHQVLTPLDGNKTLYYTADKFSGMMAPMVIKMYGEDIKKGFECVAKALKKRAEES